MKKRYKYWKRSDFVSHFGRQKQQYPIPTDFQTVVNDRRWNPSKEFNGCNVIQDDQHPSWPCFHHDYNWIVNGGGNKYDLLFRMELIAFGVPKFKANLMYIAVRIGWLFWYKWKK